MEHAGAQDLSKPPGTIRIAAFNASLSREAPGQLIGELRQGPGSAAAAQATNVAETVALAAPDVLLLNEFDFDPGGEAARLFADAFLPEGLEPAFIAPSNTGVASGLDLDNDGQTGEPEDAFGFGRFEGQYAMALFSRLPLADGLDARTFRTFLWRDLPGARLPDAEPGSGLGDYYSSEARAILPLSSKTHWDVPLALPDGRVLHILASHPTPPVFDGPEDRNGRRNADEIRFWSHYIAGGPEGRALVDDSGRAGGLEPGASFAILGDLNNDPMKGDGDRSAMAELLGQARVTDTEPAGPTSGTDTAQFRNGNLRVDYVLPSADLEIAGSGVFWPLPGQPGHHLIGEDGRATSDHRLVWVDVLLEAP